MSICGKCTTNKHHTCLDNKACECKCHIYYFCQYGTKHQNGSKCECPDPDIRPPPDPKQEARFLRLINEWKASKLDDYKAHNQRMNRLVQRGISKPEDLHFYTDEKGDIIE